MNIERVKSILPGWRIRVKEASTSKECVGTAVQHYLGHALAYVADGDDLVTFISYADLAADHYSVEVLDTSTGESVEVVAEPFDGMSSMDRLGPVAATLTHENPVQSDVGNSVHAEGKVLPLPGAPLVPTAKLYDCSAPDVWAEEFVKFFPAMDKATMTAWFSNAMETAKNLSRGSTAAMKTPVLPLVSLSDSLPMPLTSIILRDVHDTFPKAKTVSVAGRIEIFSEGD